MKRSASISTPPGAISQVPFPWIVLKNLPPRMNESTPISKQIELPDKSADVTGPAIALAQKDATMTEATPNRAMEFRIEAPPRKSSVRRKTCPGKPTIGQARGRSEGRRDYRGRDPIFLS
jgi:hypothetical protein